MKYTRKFNADAAIRAGLDVCDDTAWDEAIEIAMKALPDEDNVLPNGYALSLFIEVGGIRVPVEEAKLVLVLDFEDPEPAGEFSKEE